MKRHISLPLILAVSALFASDTLAKTCPQYGYCNVIKGECLSGQCVAYCRAKTGFSGQVGSAKNWPTNSRKPVKGGVVVFRGDRSNANMGHVAYIESVDERNKTFTVTQYNASKTMKCAECGVTDNYGVVTPSTYVFNDGRIKGFWVDPKRTQSQKPASLPRKKKTQ